MPQPGDSTKVAGMFAGIGGFELGLSDGGKFDPALFSEIDPAAQQVLRHHFPGTPIIGDVHDVRRLPQDASIVTAGFPCTDISQAGRGAVPGTRRSTRSRRGKAKAAISRPTRRAACSSSWADRRTRFAKGRRCRPFVLVRTGAPVEPRPPSHSLKRDRPKKTPR